MSHPEIPSRLFNELGLGHPKRALPQNYIPRSFVLAARVILKTTRYYAHLHLSSRQVRKH